MPRANTLLLALLLGQVALGCLRSDGNSQAVGGAGTFDAGCAPPAPSECAGACTSLANDPNNCGACGQVCSSSAVCLRGRCGPEATTLVPPSPGGCGAIHLAAADGTLYWTDEAHGTVSSVRADGTAPTTLAMNERAPAHVVARGGRVFWVATDRGAMSATPAGGVVATSVRAVPATGGAAVELVAETSHGDGILGLAVSDDGVSVYYSLDASVKMVPAAGGPASFVVLSSATVLPSAIGLEGRTLAFAETQGVVVEAVTLGDGGVVTCEPPVGDAGASAGPCNEVSDNTQAVLDAVFVHEGLVYWADSSVVSRAPAAALDAKSQNRLVAHANGTITGLVGAPSALWFTEEGHEDILLATFQVGQTQTVMARGQAPTGALAADGTRVYWVNADCSIRTSSY
jgi:hypothetical protein